ncbi:MAG: substrate-binding domain-containing protein [Ignavibacteria bacterium]
MKTTTIAAIALIIIIITGGAYAAYAYTQNQNPQPTTTPTPSPSPSPTLNPSPSPTASPNPTANPTATPSPSPTPTPAHVTLTVSSTTSLRDTGLEDTGTGNIKEAFQAKYPWITVNFLGQGTGAAIQTAMRGDADMIIVHDPTQETTFLNNGYGINRKIIAYNYFIIVGPANDPAGVFGMSPTDAMKHISDLAQAGNPNVIWVSRNDSSGTYSKEKALWTAAGLNVATLSQQTSWFKSTGSGMGTTLGVANEFNGYVLSDTGTYLAYYGTGAGQIELKPVVQDQKDLLNVYSVIVNDPRNPALTRTHFDAAMLLVNYLVSTEGQQLIGNFGKAPYGQSLFTPFVPLASGASPNATILGWIQNYAYIPAGTTECPAQFRYNAGTLYSTSYDTLSNANLNASIILPNYYTSEGQQFILAPPATLSQFTYKLSNA